MRTGRKVRLVAGDSWKYNGRQLRPGNEFECTEAEAQEFIALRLASRAPEQPAEEQTEQTEPTIELTSEQPAERRTLSVKQGSRNRYLRRDLRVGEESK